LLYLLLKYSVLEWQVHSTGQPATGISLRNRDPDERYEDARPDSTSGAGFVVHDTFVPVGADTHSGSMQPVLSTRV
jgi:hypothetical protein